jgi:hypothetical protein
MLLLSDTISPITRSSLDVLSVDTEAFPEHARSVSPFSLVAGDLDLSASGDMVATCSVKMVVQAQGARSRCVAK